MSTDKQEYHRQVNELTDYCNRVGWSVDAVFSNKVSGAKAIEAPILIKRKLLPRVSKTSFYIMLRNFFYIGRIKVPAFGQYPTFKVKAKHEPIIDMDTFRAVQEVLDGKRKQEPKMHKANNPNLYLRKYLCPRNG